MLFGEYIKPRTCVRGRARKVGSFGRRGTGVKMQEEPYSVPENIPCTCKHSGLGYSMFDGDTALENKMMAWISISINYFYVVISEAKLAK